MTFLFCSVVILLQAFYTLTYGLYCWRKGEKKAGVGISFFVILSVVFPLWMLYVRL